MFDAAVPNGWGFLGAIVDEPMCPEDAWHDFVAAHAPPNRLLVATDETGHAGCVDEEPVEDGVPAGCLERDEATEAMAEHPTSNRFR